MWKSLFIKMEILFLFFPQGNNGCTGDRFYCWTINFEYYSLNKRKFWKSFMITQRLFFRRQCILFAHYSRTNSARIPISLEKMMFDMIRG